MLEVPQKNVVYTENVDDRSHDLKQVGDILKVSVSVINQLDAQNVCFTVSLFHASTCFGHMCSKHIEA